MDQCPPCESWQFFNLSGNCLHFTKSEVHTSSTLFPILSQINPVHAFPSWFFIFIYFWRCSPTRAMASSFKRFFLVTHNRHNTVGKSPLDEWSARRRDLYLTIHNIHNRQTSMPPVEFETTILASKRPQTSALDRAATGTGTTSLYTLLTHWGRVMQICIFTLRLCKTDDANLLF